MTLRIQNRESGLRGWIARSIPDSDSRFLIPNASFKRRGRTMKRLAFLALAVLWVSPALAQLVEPNQVGARMGHVHLVVQDVDAQKNFWVSIMGGKLVKNGPLELIQF